MRCQKKHTSPRAISLAELIISQAVRHVPECPFGPGGPGSPLGPARKLKNYENNVQD